MTRPRTITRTARELARRQPRTIAVIVLQAAVAMLAVAATLIGQGQRIPLVGGDRFELRAEFANAGGLKEGKQPPVTVAGVKLGIVSKVRYERGRAIATIQLEDGAKGRIYRDAMALITPRSALNDLTVDIQPGTPATGPLAEDSVLPTRRTTGPVNLDRLAEILDSDTRAHLIVLIDQLGIGLADRTTALGRTARALAPTLDAQRRVASAMADRRRLLTSLVKDLDAVFGTLGRRGEDLRDIVRAGAQTSGAIARRQDELMATVEQLAPAFANVERAMTAIRRLSVPLNPALADLRPFAQDLGPALRELQEFVPAGRTLASDLGGIATDGARPVRSLRQLLNRLGPASTRLRPSVARLEPVLAALDENKKGIGEFGSNFSGIFSGQNANGPTLRAFGFFEPLHLENFGLAPGTSSARMGAVQRTVAAAVERLCVRGQQFACVSRYLQPGLPSQLVSSLARKRAGGDG